MRQQKSIYKVCRLVTLYLLIASISLLLAAPSSFQPLSIPVSDEDTDVGHFTWAWAYVSASYNPNTNTYSNWFHDYDYGSVVSWVTAQRGIYQTRGSPYGGFTLICTNAVLPDGSVRYNDACAYAEIGSP